jgi:SAM-dependent methyltransferase
MYKEALDVGAGSLNDSKFLLDEGYSVLAVDSSKEFLEYAQEIGHQKFKAINEPIEKYEFDRTFSLINAQFALPFINNAVFGVTISKILSCVDTGGVFCGQFFGLRDEWNTSTSPMSFHDEETVKSFFKEFTINVFKEEEEDKPTAQGDMKHWHVYHIIATKK